MKRTSTDVLCIFGLLVVLLAILLVFVNAANCVNTSDKQPSDSRFVVTRIGEFGKWNSSVMLIRDLETGREYLAVNDHGMCVLEQKQ